MGLYLHFLVFEGFREWFFQGKNFREREIAGSLVFNLVDLLFYN